MPKLQSSAATPMYTCITHMCGTYSRRISPYSCICGKLSAPPHCTTHQARSRHPASATDSAQMQSTRCAIARSEEHTSELQSLMRISYAVFCLKKKKNKTHKHNTLHNKP